MELSVKKGGQVVNFWESDKEASSEAAFAKLPQGGSESAEYVCFLHVLVGWWSNT